MNKRSSDGLMGGVRRPPAAPTNPTRVSRAAANETDEVLRREVALPDTSVGGVVHNAWCDWIAPVPWDLTVTLTFADVPPSRERALRRAEVFLSGLDSILGFDPPYFAVVEGGPEGEIRTHVHVLLAGVAHIPIIRGLLREGQGRRPWPDGHLKIECFHSISAWYATKTLSAGAPHLFAPRFWSRVHGVNRFAKLRGKVRAEARRHEVAIAEHDGRQGSKHG